MSIFISISNNIYSDFKTQKINLQLQKVYSQKTAKRVTVKIRVEKRVKKHL